MNRKATITEVIFLVIVLFILGIGFLMARVWTSQLATELVNNPTINQSEGARNAIQSIDKVQNRFDYVIFGAFIAMVLGMLIASWFIAGNGIYTFVYFIALVFAIVLSAIMANMWSEFFNNSLLAAQQSYFPITDNLITYSPYYLAVLGFLSIIIMFAKPRVE